MQTWEQRYEVAGSTTIAVEQKDGALRITGWEKQQVEVKVAWPGEGTVTDRLDVVVTGNRISLTVKPYRTGFLGLVTDSLLDLEISVPVGTRCELETGSGLVSVTDTQGPVEVEGGSGPVQLTGVGRVEVDAGSGSVQVRTASGPVNIETGSGRIDLAMAAGPVSLETGSGSVAVRQVAKGMTVETGSGSIAVVDVEGRLGLEAGSGSIAASRIASDQMNVETGAGSIRLQGLDVRQLDVETGSGLVETELLRIHPDGVYRLETGSGRVTVALPADAGLTLNLETHGRVDYGPFPVKIIRQDDDQIEAVLGQGGPLLQVETGSGAISLTERQDEHRPTDEEVAATRLTQMVKDDPALEQSAQLSRIIQMVRENRLSVEQAEEILRALNEEEDSREQ